MNTLLVDVNLRGSVDLTALQMLQRVLRAIRWDLQTKIPIVETCFYNVKRVV